MITALTVIFTALTAYLAFISLQILKISLKVSKLATDYVSAVKAHGEAVAGLDVLKKLGTQTGDYKENIDASWPQRQIRDLAVDNVLLLVFIVAASVLLSFYISAMFIVPTIFAIVATLAICMSIAIDLSADRYVANNIANPA